MAVTSVVRQFSEYQWLSSDLNSIDYQTLVATANDGQQGRELDTGREFYFSTAVGRFVEYKRPEVLLLQEVLRAIKGHSRALRQIRNATGSLAFDDIGDGLPDGDR